jgi:hypothetical protein
MTVRLDGEVIRLEGECRLEEAESLVALLCEGSARTVDLSTCQGLHGAVLQVLLKFIPPVIGEPQDAFLRKFVAPGLRQTDDRVEGRADARDYLE